MKGATSISMAPWRTIGPFPSPKDVSLASDMGYSKVMAKTVLTVTLTS